MTNWRRLTLPLVATAILLVTSAPMASGQKAQTTTTVNAENGSRIPSNGVAPVDPNAIINSWALAPAGSQDPNQPGERPYFSYTADPGTTVSDSAILYNLSNVPLTFDLYATDAFNNAEGAFDVLAGDKKPTDVGTWVTLPQRSITLPARTQATFPVAFTIPSEASPGDHAGALLASSPTSGTGPDGKTITVDRRTGARIYIRVAGPLTPELAITKVKTTYRARLNPFAGKNDVSYTIENQGNVRLAGKHKVRVNGLFGLGGKGTKYADLPELLPGQHVTLHASFKGVPATLLDFAKVTLDPNDADGKTLHVVTRRAATIAIPWTIVALAFIIGFGRYAQRAYKRHRGDEPEVTAAPS